MTVILRTVFCLLVAHSVVSVSNAAERFNSKEFQTDAVFELTVSKSKTLKPGASKITTQSAYVSLAHGLLGSSDGLEVMFFTKPITQVTLPDIMNNDAKELRKNDYAAMVLFLDKEGKVWQVNLSYVVPGTTVSRTIAWKPDDLKRYFSGMRFKNGRLFLKSTGDYSETDSAAEVMKLTWRIDLDLPVKREVKRGVQ